MTGDAPDSSGGVRLPTLDVMVIKRAIRTRRPGTAMIRPARRPRRRLVVGGLAVVVLAGLVSACVPPPPPPPSVLEVATTPEFSPAFDPQITDYVAPCGDGAPITVSAAVPDGGLVSIDGQPFQPGRFYTTTSRTEGLAFTVEYQAPPGQTSRTYYIRCLPTDFPRTTSVGTAQHAAWFVTDPIRLDQNFQIRGRPIIFDRHGVPVWWGPDQLSAYTTVGPDGDLVSAFGDGLVGRNLDGSPSQIDVPIDQHDAHDWVALANGNFVVVVNQQIEHQDLTSIGGPPDGTLLNQVVQEVDPDGVVQWSWSVNDHIAITEMAAQFRPDVAPPIGNVYDVYHWNSIDAMGDGTYLLSFRHLNAVYKIDPAGGVIWRLSGEGPVTEGDQLTIVDDPAIPTADEHFGGQHDARVLGDGTSTSYEVALHDNRTGLGAPRAVRYAIDETAKTATLLTSTSTSAAPTSMCCGSARWFSAGGWVTAIGGTTIGGELTAAGGRPFTIDLTAPWFYYRLTPFPQEQFAIEDLRAGMEAMWAPGAITTLDTRDHPPMPLP